MTQVSTAIRSSIPTKRAKASLKKIARHITRPVSSLPLPKQSKLRILSIDGGGIRAILPAILIAKLEEELQISSGNPRASIIDYFDLFAGTSAGAILISLYLTPSPTDPNRPKYTAKEVLGIYMEDGCESFAPLNTDAKTSRSEKYSATILEEKLQGVLGAETRFDQLLKPTLITAYNMETESPVFFENWKAGDAKVWQLARATSAAPGMFRPAQYADLESGQALIDGSIFASNPAMCAYTLSSHTSFSQVASCSFAKDFPSIDDMLLFSVGTGKALKTEDKQKSSWIRMMMKNLMSSGTALVDHQLRQLFSNQRKGKYYRFNPNLPAADTIDNVGAKHVDALCQLGTEYFEQQASKIEELLGAILGR